MIEVKIGELYQNRTLKYLVPALNYYGPTLKTKLNLGFKLAFGIFDTSLEGSYLEGQKNIFILMDRAVKPDMYASFCKWIKLQEYYVTDYSYDDMETGRRQMFVLAFPPALEDSYSKFLKGQYSFMYTKTEIAAYFGEPRKAEARGVFQRDLHAKIEYIKKVREEYNTNLLPEDFKNHRHEYDFPPNKEEEFFN